MPTVQEALAGLQNPANMRQAILQRLNLNPTQLGVNQIGGIGSNSEFDRSIDDLYRQGAETSGSLDRSEGDVNTNYDRSMAQEVIDRDKALNSIRNNFANRGMSFSSSHADELGRANGDFDRYVNQLGADRATNLTDIGGRRNSLIEGLGRGRQTAEQGYGEGISSFLQEQAVAAWNAAIQQNQQKALLAAQAKPPQIINRTVVQKAPAALPSAPPPPVATSYTGAYNNPATAVNKTKNYNLIRTSGPQ